MEKKKKKKPALYIQSLQISAVQIKQEAHEKCNLEAFKSNKTPQKDLFWAYIWTAAKPTVFLFNCKLFKATSGAQYERHPSGHFPGRYQGLHVSPPYGLT